MTPRFIITSVVLVLLFSIGFGHPVPSSQADQPTTEAILNSCSFTASPCNLSSSLQEPYMFLRNMKDSLSYRQLNVTVTFNSTAQLTDLASSLRRVHRDTHSMECPTAGDEPRTHLCASKYQFTEDHAHPPAWRANACLIGHKEDTIQLNQEGAVTTDGAQGDAIECQCEAVVAPFNVLTFTCSEGKEKFAWTTSSAIVGYTCVPTRTL